MKEKRFENLRALLIFPRSQDRELDLAPVHLERLRGRLPWHHRARPSATLHESVVSTDADRLMDEYGGVK